MKITNSNFYFITLTALAALLVIGLYFFSRKHNCCGDCHVHGADATEQVTEQVAETPAEQIAAEATSDIHPELVEGAAEPALAETTATQNLK